MNIELHGFLAQNFIHIKESIFVHLKAADTKVASETLVTYVSDVTEGVLSNHREPFIRIFSDNKSDFKVASKALPYVHFPGFYHRESRQIVMECVPLAYCMKV
jgi:hypothetical protein